MKRFVLMVLIMHTCMIRPSQAQPTPAQTKGEIRGKVTDSKTKKPLDYGSIIIENDRRKVVAHALTDDDGYYIVKQLEPGEYTVKCTYIGYLNSVITAVNVEADFIRFVNLPMEVNKNSKAVYRTLCCCFGSGSAMPKIDKKPELLHLQSQYAVQKDEHFNCVMPHKSRAIEQQLKESAVKLFNDVRSFPSPTNTVLNIESMYDGEKEVLIRSISGAEFFHGTIVHHVQLDVSSFPAGIYVVLVIDKANDEKNYTKFLVSK